MFEGLAKHSLKGQRAPSALLSFVLHGVAAFFLLTRYVGGPAAKTVDPIPVSFRAFAPPPPPPPPPPARKARVKPKKAVVTKVAAPTIVVPPKELPKVEEKPPENLPEPEEEDDDEGVEGGVEGGVAGGALGGILGGTGTAPPPPQRMEFNDRLMTPPRMVSGPNPQYTQKALDQEVQGVMVIKCIVTVDGAVYGCRIVQRLPFMDKAVVDALQQRRYTPALLDGRPVEVEYTFHIRLSLPR